MPGHRVTPRASAQRRLRPALAAAACAVSAAACGGDAHPGGSGAVQITPAQSRAWTWSACGTIPADAANGPAVFEAQFAPDGNALALGWSDGRIQI